MMRRICGLLMMLVGMTSADPTVYATGVGARAFGLANSFTAVADDFSSLFWNPAGMAFVQTREVHGSIDIEKQEVDTRLGSTVTSSMIQRPRIGSAGWLRSQPTTQGGFSFAIGFSTPYLLDDLNYARGIDIYRGAKPDTGHFNGILRAGDTLMRDRLSHVTRGACNLYSLGLGWQVAPGLGFGFSAGLLFGDERRQNEFVSRIGSRPFEDTREELTRTYMSYDARLGVLYKPLQWLSVGGRLELPRMNSGVEESLMQYDRIAGIRYEFSRSGTLETPMAGGLGVAVNLPFLMVSADATLRAPMNDVPLGSEQAFWKEGYGIGVELPVRILSSVVRCGYAWREFDGLPFTIRWDEDGIDLDVLQGLRDHRLYTIGYSLYLGANACLELAYGHLGWKTSSTLPDWQDPLVETHTLGRGTVALTVSY